MSISKIKKSVRRTLWQATAALLIIAGIWYGLSQDRELTPAAQSGQELLDKVFIIRKAQEVPEQAETVKSELDLLREQTDWSDAPSPAPVLVETTEFDVYRNVTKEYLLYVFDKLGYTGDKIASGETSAIPPLFVISIGKGWADDETVNLKKSLFYRVILPLILYENEAVLRERSRLLALDEALKLNGALDTEDTAWLNTKALEYKAIGKEQIVVDVAAVLEALIIRVDMVPPSLALGQAAYESGYATSRFAHTANSLFGQWDWGANAIKPKQPRAEKGNYGIAAFEYPIDSVRAYIWNLNTHRSYQSFRELRNIQRGNREGKIEFDVPPLADTLIKYSERGAAYTKELNGIISFNGLAIADGLRLIEGEPIYFGGKTE